MRSFLVHFCAFIFIVVSRSTFGSVMHTGTLTPYDVVAPVMDRYRMRNGFTEAERHSMDVTWNALENYAGSENALAVVDGSGSMYGGYKPLPAAVAQSLGIYFAEHNTGAFKGHFITFSTHPRLIEVKGRTFFWVALFCVKFEISLQIDGLYFNK